MLHDDNDGSRRGAERGVAQETAIASPLLADDLEDGVRAGGEERDGAAGGLKAVGRVQDDGVAVHVEVAVVDGRRIGERGEIPNAGAAGKAVTDAHVFGIVDAVDQLARLQNDLVELLGRRRLDDDAPDDSGGGLRRGRGKKEESGHGENRRGRNK